METFLALVAGIGLSAACGFRVFVPLLGVSAAAMAGVLEPSSGFEWIGSWPAVTAFATATVLEIVAYYVPWVDNVMDTLTTPAAIAAGIVVTASVFADVSPFLKWTMAVIAGGGAAAAFQAATVALRTGSTLTTGGSANFVISSVELSIAVALNILALLLPIFCIAAIIYISWKIFRWLTKPRLEAASS